MIKAIMFDMGDTIISNKNLDYRGAAIKMYDSLNLDCNMDEYSAYIDNYIQNELLKREENELRFCDLVTDLVNKHNGKLTKTIFEIEKEFDKNFSKVELVKDLVKFLDLLKKKNYKLIVLSNTQFSKELLINNLEEFNILKYFDEVFVSSSYGVRKPNEYFFKQGIDYLGYKKSEIIYIGNSYIADVLGAKRSGIRCIWLNEPGFEGVIDDDCCMIKSYNELLNIKCLDELFIKNNFSDDAYEIISILNNNGYEAYLVGGSVRDSLLNKNINDYDITTNALPKTIVKLFNDNGYHTVLTGEKHGTVTVIKNHIPFEVTTYRKDGEYLDNRHPSNVSFCGDLIEDLKRRDFTINAFAYNGKELIDEFDGINDLNNRIIKAVGNPSIRFEEDALRILRALRFACQLNFKIEEKTSKSIKDKYQLLKNISIERINDEIFKLLKFRCKDIFVQYKYVFEYVYNINLEEDFDILNKPLSNIMKFAYLTRNSSLDYSSLKISNNLKNEIVIYQSLSDFEYDEYQLRLGIVKYGMKQLTKNLKYSKYIFKWENIVYKNITLKLKALHDIIYSVNDLKINGNDLMKLGFIGKDISKIKDVLLEQVLKGQLNNKKEEFVVFLEKSIKNV